MSSQWKLVPVEPTETMVINGFESVPDECFSDEEVWGQYQAMSGCQQAAFRAKLCWAAMIGAAPTSPEKDAQPVMKLEAEKLWGGHGEYAVSFVRAGWLDECRASGGEFLLYTHPDEGKIARLTAERDALQQRLTAADEELDRAGSQYINKNGDCTWSQWNSTCGVSWAFMDGSPQSHGMHFCHGCGKALVLNDEGEGDD